MFLILVLQPSLLLSFSVYFSTQYILLRHPIVAQRQCGLCIRLCHQMLDQLPFVLGLRQTWQQWSYSVVYGLVCGMLYGSTQMLKP